MSMMIARRPKLATRRAGMLQHDVVPSAMISYHLCCYRRGWLLLFEYQRRRDLRRSCVYELHRLLWGRRTWLTASMLELELLWWRCDCICWWCRCGDHSYLLRSSFYRSRSRRSTRDHKLFRPSAEPKTEVRWLDFPPDERWSAATG